MEAATQQPDLGPYRPRVLKRGRLAMLRVLLLAAWLLTLGWLIRFEAFPGWFAHVMTGYKGLLSDGVLISDEWMKIEFDGHQVGYSHTRLDTRDKDPLLQYEMTNETYLQLNLMGSRQQVRVTGSASLDTFYDLQRFTFSMNSRNYRMKISGDRVKGERFKVQIQTKAGNQAMDVTVPRDALVYSPMLELSLRKLPIGGSMRVRLFEPLSLRAEDVVVKALRREPLEHDGAIVLTTLLETDYQGMKVHSWMNADGKILKQVTPMGWTLTACAASEALDFDAAEGLGQDMLRAMAVPCKGALPDPRNRRNLELRLTGLQLDLAELNSFRQTARREADDSVRLSIRVPDWPADSNGDPLPDDLLEKALESTAFVQSDHPDILRQARRIVQGHSDPLDQLQALNDWVYRKVKKNPAISLPSALDVLKTREGDCNEHTYLFVALARSLGLPALIKVGLVYHEGGFYYHAWPAAYAGQWIELDPTFGQPVADATHLALLDGELGDQMKLLAVVGRVAVEVIAEDGMDEENISHD